MIWANALDELLRWPYAILIHYENPGFEFGIKTASDCISRVIKQFKAILMTAQPTLRLNALYFYHLGIYVLEV